MQRFNRFLVIALILLSGLAEADGLNAVVTFDSKKVTIETVNHDLVDHKATIVGPFENGRLVDIHFSIDESLWPALRDSLRANEQIISVELSDDFEKTRKPFLSDEFKSFRIKHKDHFEVLLIGPHFKLARLRDELKKMKSEIVAMRGSGNRSQFVFVKVPNSKLDLYFEKYYFSEELIGNIQIDTLLLNGPPRDDTACDEAFWRDFDKNDWLEE